MKDNQKKFSRLPLKGMEDFYPSDIREINWIIEQIRDIVDLYSYEEYLILYPYGRLLMMIF